MIALLLIVGCASDGPRSDVGGADTGGTTGPTYICGDWVPWIAGRSLTWHMTGAEWSYTLTRTVEVMDEDGTVERSYVADDAYNPGTGGDSGHCDDRGYIMERNDAHGEAYDETYSYSPGMLSIPRPQALGATWEDAYAVEWTYNGDSGSYEDGYSYAVVDEQTLSVAVGTVQASRIQMRNLGDALVADRWYAPGFGLVMSVVYDGEMNTTQTSELVSINDAE